MERRRFLLAATALLAAGCARVPPKKDVAGAAGLATPAAPGQLLIGSEGSVTVALMAQLLVRSLAAKERAAGTEEFGDAWQAALGAGESAAKPAYAGTLWADLGGGGDAPAAADLASEVADLVSPEVSVVSAAGVDGSLMWVVTESTASAGITTMDGIAQWSRGKVAAVPEFAVSRADGLPALKTAYGAAFTVSKTESPRERAAALTTGRVAIAAFRRSEDCGTGLFELADTNKIELPDPAVILVSSKLVDAEPDIALAMQAVAAKLSTGPLRDFQAKLAGGASGDAVLDAWLKAEGLA
jgi:glycine betaine/choline ABC-type transport system substrate-binding protein